jgi:response regulator RpfG family c-di-GMP phosphodiesterase
MNSKILLVDDEQNILASLKRQLRKAFNITTALGPEKGLEAVKDDGPFAVIMSDLRMPVMDGIQFLSKTRELAPDTVRMMLTGNADLQNAMKAVNEGNIYRFLTKPCSPDNLTQVLNQGVEQYRLVKAEKELLEKTLKGSIKMLTELLAMLNPEAFGRAAPFKRYVHSIAEHLAASNIWEIETAAMLSQIGCVTLPEETIQKLYTGRDLNKDDLRLFMSHPKVASDLLAHIPRMENVAEMILYQNKLFEGGGLPADDRKGETIPLGGRILKVVADFDLLETRGHSKPKAIKQMRKREGWYDLNVLDALESILGVEAKFVFKDLELIELRRGMIFAQDVTSVKGQLLVSRGQEVSSVMIERLVNYSTTTSIAQPIRVIVPV